MKCLKWLESKIRFRQGGGRVLRTGHVCAWKVLRIHDWFLECIRIYFTRCRTMGGKIFPSPDERFFYTDTVTRDVLIQAS